MKYILIVFLSFLTACSSNDIQKKTDQIVKDKFGNEVVFPSENDLKECDDFPEFKGKTLGDLYEFTVLNAKLYEECSNKAKVNQDFIKRVYKK